MWTLEYVLVGKKDTDVIAKAFESYKVGHILKDGRVRLNDAKLNS